MHEQLLEVGYHRRVWKFFFYATRSSISAPTKIRSTRTGEEAKVGIEKSRSIGIPNIANLPDESTFALPGAFRRFQRSKGHKHLGQ